MTIEQAKAILAETPPDFEFEESMMGDKWVSLNLPIEFETMEEAVEYSEAIKMLINR